MTIAIKSRFELSDKVEFIQDKNHVNWYKGVVCKIKWDKDSREFMYLIEKENGERIWVYEQNAIPYEQEANK